MKKHLSIFIFAFIIKLMKIEILALALIGFSNSVAFAQKIVWKPKAPLPVVCFGNTATICNDRIYYFGATSKQSNGERYSYTNVLIFDIANDYWVTKPCKEIGGSHFAVNTIDGLIYVIGGGDSCSNTDIYNPATDTWTTGAAMPTGRLHIKAAVVDGKIYVMGGFSSDYNTIYGVNEVYDPQTNIWTQKKPIPEPRENVKPAVIDNKIYLFGGGTTGNNTATSIYVYDPANDTWENISSMPATKYLHAIAAIDKKVIIAAGYHNGSPSARVDVFDPANKSWTQCNSLPKNIVEMPYASNNNSIYIIGGRNDGDINNLPVYNSVYEGIFIPEGNFTPAVYQPIPDTSIMVGKKYTYRIPDFTFIDDDVLTYSGKHSNGDNLPAWLVFTPSTRTFSGTPLNTETLTIRVTVTDKESVSVYDEFQVTVANATNIEDKQRQFPEESMLWQNYPNPFNPSTVIGYQLPAAGRVNLTIYNLLGQKIKTLVDSFQNAGEYSIVWDANDEHGYPLTSGIYFYRIETQNSIMGRKMVLVR